jgi:hypothetical protein
VQRREEGTTIYSRFPNVKRGLKREPIVEDFLKATHDSTLHIAF